ncbi:MoaD/ThiS family protein [Dethiobacter alkaliphilus]|uniref:ThiamineS protein n=1 Tax=Dethiobacter alkaliphilus AHT 1 TaxID=555088 RepID=C0GFW5_DETAL|nr:MoaD/ThiS family protein [Dethiobacter alkaliphilus]EEG77654.1 thiamineS protein [Dethiobacter alkaliphilus AHT 1]
MTIYLPTPLRRHAGGAREVEVSGSTIREVFTGLKENYPDLASQLWDDEADDLKKYLSVFLNDENVRNLQGPDTPVGEKDEISVIPAIAGGSR